jgi:outer membrane protein TolC
MPDSPMQAFTGTDFKEYNASVSLAHIFPTGTTVAFGVKELYKRTTPPDTNQVVDPEYHNPSVFMMIQQELVKNSFGKTDRLLNEILESATEMQRAAIINYLSYLIAGALVDYWTVAIDKSAVEIAQVELKTNQQVRDIIARNANFGLAESYDLNQYNALIAGSEIKTAQTEQNLRDAIRKLIRTLNLPPDTKIKGVTELSDVLPDFNVENGLKAAYAKRVDFINALKALEISRKDFEIQKNNALPSLTFNLGVNSQGYEGIDPVNSGPKPKIAPAIGEALTGEFPALQAQLKCTYPLDDSDLKTNIRNSYFKVKKAELAIENLKQEIRDNVYSSYEQVKLAHLALTKARTARKESEEFHGKLITKFRQGKMPSVAVKAATDVMMQARHGELQALVGFNIALLGYDLAKNEIFEKYNIVPEKYIKAIKE